MEPVEVIVGLAEVRLQGVGRDIRGVREQGGDRAPQDVSIP